MRSRAIIMGIAALMLVIVVAIGVVNHKIQAPESAGIARPAGLSEPAGQAELGASAPLDAPTSHGIVVGRDYKHDVSPLLRDMPPKSVLGGTRKEEANDNQSIPLYGHKDVPDSIVQRVVGPLSMPTPITTFEGINIDEGCGGCSPPDTNGEVGPNNYVQSVNTAFQVWDKSGNVVLAARAINTLWTGFGGPCETRNDGDPIVMYDQLADRWLISQFTDAAPYNECIAISTTSDPTGAYHRYAFVVNATNFEDYPKFGVWPDGYYMSANQFNGDTYAGPRPYVFDRASMLQGQPATFQTTADALGDTVGFFLPSDLDGSTQPPAGAPNHYLSFGSPMALFEFHVDWANPANTTFNHVTDVTNAGFTQLCVGNQDCIRQPNTAVGLDGLADRSMFRLAYRNFGDHESLVGNFTVDAGGGQAGVRWYEVRSPGANATLFQEGTYAPGTVSRWMGSVAMDHDGNLAVGFSASDSAIFPSIIYAGRLATDPIGELTQGGATMFAGLGSQLSTGHRWGDYSNMTVDPTDDCTFWYANEYNPTTGEVVWHTRIGSFKFPGCGAAQASPTPGTPAPTNTPTNTPNPIATETPAPVCGPNWSVVSSPNVFTNTNVLNGVAAVSASDVWAVGNYLNGTTQQTLAEHWDASAWSVVSSPNVLTYTNMLNGVAAASASDVWAVGLYGNGTGYQTLVEHWDGSAWNVVSSPNVGTIFNRLNGVAAVSATDVWAVGNYNNGSALQTLVEHWDGSAWNVVSSPNVGTGDNHLNGVAAASASDVWAVGNYSNGTMNQTLVEHWDGSAWSVVSSPNVGTGDNHLNGVAAVSTSDVWAVGYSLNGSALQTLAEHWDGSTWSVVPSSNVGTHDNVLNGVAAISTGDVWAVGYYGLNGSFLNQTLAEHWDGSAWSVVPSSNVGTHANVLNGAAAVSASDVWAVGNYDLNGSFLNQTLVERYNPCPPTPTPGATPTTCSIQFSDVPPGSTFYPYVHCMACRGIINGYPDGTFKPNHNVTRGQLSKIVSNSAGFNDPQDTQMFEDVPVGSTFFDFIGRLASRGYIGGYPCGGPGEPCGPDNLPYFRPNNNATRGQISKINSNAAGFNDDPTGQQFEDVDVGSAFYTYTYRLVTRSVMSGYACGGNGEPCIPPDNLPYFRPNNNATRGQTSKIVANTFFPNCQTPAQRK